MLRLRCFSFLCALLAASAARAQQLTYLSSIANDVGKPTGLALDVIGGVTFLYVSDHNGGRVFKYNLATGARTQIGFPGRGPGQFVWPDSIGIDPATRDLYIADRQLHRVTRLKNDGTFVMKWGDTGTETNRFGHPGAGSAPGQFNGVQGLVVDPDGLVYTTEHENHRVQKFRVTSSGGAWNVETLAVWGGGGGAPGQFNTPYGITFDPAGNVWVADGFNSRLQKFSPGGQLLGQVTVRGPNEPHLVCTWVTFERSGDFWVSVTSDPNTGGVLENQRVEKFSAAGVSLAKWGRYGSEPGNFKLPFAIAIDPATNRAYVADWDNGRIQVFSVGAPPADGSGGDGPTPNRLLNVSTRVAVSATDASRTAVAGFVISGSAAKPVLVRAVGPGLAAFGVNGALANPRLQLFDAGGRVVTTNDDWGGASDVAAAAERVGAFRLANDSRDAALTATLPPGNYTAQVTTASGAGIALVEIYDASSRTPATAEKLINLSTRGFVDTGEGQLLAGFVIGGDAPKRVLVRGIGPGLTAFGVAGAISDPTLRVFASGSSSPLTQNDQWETPQLVVGGAVPATGPEISAAARAVGAFALVAGSRDAAVLVTLPPGNYSAVVSGANGLTGAGLVEVYEVP